MTTYRGHRLWLEFEADLVAGHAEDPEDPDQVRMTVRGATRREVEARLRELVDQGEAVTGAAAAV